MKKMLSAILGAATLTLCAGYEFPVDGKFRHLQNGMPERWQISDVSSAKIVRGENFFSRALELTAGKSAVQAVCKQTFPVLTDDFVKVEAEVKGHGNAFLAVEVLDAAGKTVAVKKIAVRPATDRFADLKGKLRVADYAKYAPVTVRIIIGAEAGAKIAFYDVEAESDND